MSITPLRPRTGPNSPGGPPIRLVTIGAGPRKLEIGNEVVLFRHEKTFYHQPGLVIRVKDNDPDLAAKIAEMRARMHAAHPNRSGLCADALCLPLDNQSGVCSKTCSTRMSTARQGQWAARSDTCRGTPTKSRDFVSPAR